MAKDPAFLFYSSDFLNGVSDLTMEERGQYITLLCLQHQKGSISEKTIRLSVGSVSDDVLVKFSKDETGCYYQERLREEIEKRAIFTESRRNNGKKGGRKPNGLANNIPNGYPTNNHIEDENENENEDRNDKGVQGELSELEINLTIEFISITGQRNLSIDQVKSYWQAFKIHSPENKYEPRNKRMMHFRNWLKKQLNGNRNQNNRPITADTTKPGYVHTEQL